jgi:hypothetical protein
MKEEFNKYIESLKTKQNGNKNFLCQIKNSFESLSSILSQEKIRISGLEDTVDIIKKTEIYGKKE